MGEERNPDQPVSVVDVYDIASAIGKECERIIDEYGADAVRCLMPRIINALELLETLATRAEKEDSDMAELRARVSQLEHDKLERAEYRYRFEKDLESIEETWRAETKELVSLVAELQEENRRLKRPLNEPLPQQFADAAARDMLQRLQGAMEKQSDIMREKDKILQEKCFEHGNVQQHNDRLTQVCRELRRKNSLLQAQVRRLCDESAQFMELYEEQQMENERLRQQLGLVRRDRDDVAKETAGDDVHILPSRQDLQSKLMMNVEAELFSLNVQADIQDDSSLIDAPVQGPLPLEPDDAPWKRKRETGVRKLFKTISDTLTKYTTVATNITESSSSSDAQRPSTSKSRSFRPTELLSI